MNLGRKSILQFQDCKKIVGYPSPDIFIEGNSRTIIKNDVNGAGRINMSSVESFTFRKQQSHLLKCSKW